MKQEKELERLEGYVDCRNRPALHGKHGGMLAASFVLVVEVMENLAFLATASNLVTYLTGYMHLSLSESAVTVNNFMATSFLLALLGAFLSDAFCTTYIIYLVSAIIEFLGLVILTIQARSASLKPPPCFPSSPACQSMTSSQVAMLFGGLYLSALGIGGIKGSLAPHGAEQFDKDTVQGRNGRSTFFNYFVFSLAGGGLIAVTFVVWMEDNEGWQWGFGISMIAILLSIVVFVSGSQLYRNKKPTGSPLTTIGKVFAAAIFSHRPSQCTIDSNAGIDHSLGTADTVPSNELTFLNRAVEDDQCIKFLHCTIEEVEDVKIVIQLIPIFLSTIVLNCCLAQLSTFSVEQAATMDTHVGSFKVPPASLPIFPIIFMMIMAPVYDHVILPFARKVTRTEVGITHLQRIGTGLVLSIVAMAVAALVEVKRKRVAAEAGLLDSKDPLPISFFWIAFQYLFLGSADLFTLAGLLEFFFSEAPAKMRSLATSLSWTSLALGYYLSSVLVKIVNSATGNGSHLPWLKGTNLNHYHLERFYWLMCALSSVNYLCFLFCATRYLYKRSGTKG
ncbi:Major facilitator superfamily protein [Rhynchospora pubera]|uniref:Major facilitator superfamily protein n=1 Tax=Rhynchospora pubera TaxID=906938 RepID=A0AAV8GTG4_9POAL|nr:Major facilitator superfamily protein [Rhynchospora pubera]